MMRIISGKFKSRKIHSDQFKKLRPTLDRVKQTIFDILFNYINIEDKNVLDGFAGTGNLGLESLSRGSSRVFFVDNNFKAYRLIKKNVDTLEVNDKSEIIKMNFYSFIKEYNKDNYFDLVFLDPPYNEDHLERILLNNNFLRICKKNSIIVAEVEKNYEILYNEYWKLINQREISNTKVYFLKKLKG
ncbi:MAG: 16S rRNA (guanine(966)-N(2))-methyltransferase RsmD [Candidatus Mcinerneyibacterium aminivorans]|uniref:16S rRNA (Guanine(966)-N(2))-methyltransferase RsmD n=1 Tax=Candidatus Mcinerneyibacterium aminivorans TaxID=2703815 RepID=A0A5D0M975_9BACT|nr:MAG: 16S rRNA (guanine(966)-N(2))-methyltransferase RsmD [Candidatus Mcinerneyibacterium aminivorans]